MSAVLIPRIESRILTLRGHRVVIQAANVLASAQAVEQVFDALREFMVPPDPPKRPIGFVPPEDRKNESAGGAARKTAAGHAPAEGGDPP